MKDSHFPEDEDELAEALEEEEAIFFLESTRMMRSSAGEVDRRLTLPRSSGRSNMLLFPLLVPEEPPPAEALLWLTDCLGYTIFVM